MKVLLVDDEHLIREGLLHSVHWAKHGMEVVGTAEDGECALELVRSLRPDLVITDICMPFIDGLTLAETLQQERPEICIILLTSYDEFSYAKRAVKLGIVDYVLKPIDLDYMENLLDEVAAKFDEQRVAQIQSARKRVLTDLLHRQGEIPQSLQALKQADLAPAMCYACIMVNILGYRFAKDMFGERELQDYFNRFSAQVKECANEISIFEECSVAEGSVLLVVSGKAPQQTAQRMQDICHALQENEELSNEFPFLCATDDIVRDISDLQESFYHCQEVMKYDFLYDNTVFLDYSMLRHLQQDDGTQLPNAIAGFVDCVRTFDRKLIKRNMTAIVDHVRESGRYSAMYGQMLIAAAYSQVVGTLQEFHIELEDVFEDPIEEYRSIVTAGTLYKQMNGLVEMLDKVCEYVHSKQGTAHHALVETARQYIDVHFTEHEISLQSVADSVHMSSCYFSILFKQESGESFISYLTGLRIEKAKQLLRYTDQKSYEIALAVGYENATYFSTLFKKNTGLSPKEYRQGCLE